jgi:ubiquinol-cytochrome c reductase iron-sulfur subunit
MHPAAGGGNGVTSRRRLLFTATAAAAVVGAGAASWPLVSQLMPGADVVASGDRLEVDLAALRPAEPRALRWQNVPVFVALRTPTMLEAMQRPDFVSRLVDPDSRKRQQPAYAANWHRSIDPACAVLVGVCTACACVPQFSADPVLMDVPGGYVCPCCASHFDPAGRAYSGIAQFNLPVPPHALVSRTRLVLGPTARDEMFSLRTVERL